jgi:hypothetical protein
LCHSLVSAWKEQPSTALYAAPGGDPGEDPSAPSAGDLQEMTRSVLRDDPTLLSAGAGHAPSTSVRTSSGKLDGFRFTREDKG